MQINSVLFGNEPEKRLTRSSIDNVCTIIPTLAIRLIFPFSFLSVSSLFALVCFGLLFVPVCKETYIRSSSTRIHEISWEKINFPIVLRDLIPSLLFSIYFPSSNFARLVSYQQSIPQLKHYWFLRDGPITSFYRFQFLNNNWNKTDIALRRRY